MKNSREIYDNLCLIYSNFFPKYNRTKLYLTITKRIYL